MPPVADLDARASPAGRRLSSSSSAPRGQDKDVDRRPEYAGPLDSLRGGPLPRRAIALTWTKSAMLPPVATAVWSASKPAAPVAEW